MEVLNHPGHNQEKGFKKGIWLWLSLSRGTLPILSSNYKKAEFYNPSEGYKPTSRCLFFNLFLLLCCYLVAFSLDLHWLNVVPCMHSADEIVICHINSLCYTFTDRPIVYTHSSPHTVGLVLVWIHLLLPFHHLICNAPFPQSNSLLLFSAHTSEYPTCIWELL